MAVSSDIAAMYRRPSAVIRAKMAQPRNEPRLLSYLLVGCFLMFVAQAPGQSRAAYLDPEVPLEARLYWSFLFLVFILPFAFFLLAAVSRIVARVLGGRGSWYSARLSLFWSVLAAAPVWLLTGMVAAFIGPGPSLTLTAGVALGVFLLFWGRSLVATETEKADLPA